MLALGTCFLRQVLALVFAYSRKEPSYFQFGTLNFAKIKSSYGFFALEFKLSKSLKGLYILYRTYTGGEATP